MEPTDSFEAFVIDERDGKRCAGFTQLRLSDLPDRDVLVEIVCSSVNYKDGLALTGKGRIARTAPMVADIDLAGRVVCSRSPAWQAGGRVLANGWGLSETEWGGFSRYQRLKSEWLLPVPGRFSFEQAMALGTAGYTAALCVDALEAAGIARGTAVVTGAAGGVGSFAVTLLASAGWTVIASTGRLKEHDYLRSLGADTIIDRSELASPGAPFQKERWIAGIDTVGGATLVNVLAQTHRDGAIAACGLAGSADLPASVLPFILGSISLLGVDSVMASTNRRNAAWARLERDLDFATLSQMYEVRPFHGLPEVSAEILSGTVRGRIVLDIADNEGSQGAVGQ